MALVVLCTCAFVVRCLVRLAQNDVVRAYSLQELAAMRGVLHLIYLKVVPARPHLRSLLNDFFGIAVRKSFTRPLGVAELLEVSAAIGTVRCLASF